jgi:hypothetical protein
MSNTVVEVLHVAERYFGVYRNIKRGLFVAALTGGYLTYKVLSALYHRLFSMFVDHCPTNTKENDVKGKVAVVTGGSSGIGEAIAKGTVYSIFPKHFHSISR